MPDASQTDRDDRRGPHVIMERWDPVPGSPLGPLSLVSDGDSLLAVDFAPFDTRLKDLLARHHGAVTTHPGRIPEPIRTALAAWFAGDLAALDAVPTRTGGTPFQRAVWDGLRAIPPGETESYGTLAARLGRSGAARAVGRANALNPLAIVVPCHRVVGAGGTLTGYAGGLDRKRWLLDHEARHRRR
ncbi:methylated-DNA--[protein]-cysteine S-methyltransferase [Roseospira visakhapatnamensis]|uniref:Methylated-DNA--protein-cysteine methyltransferase n=1 Tax=Roseospira visakhapatnamensis TaxID=390880 RepID=A0A7W6RE91_9PROT|nr:methylated-DNA--[protein]-cysteine S-methyltransferase [Roseospira visakhapatnamensis]MBB4266949.1 methylated-DNA-[protein]-cysteine S-methyltransferase [Roseospira visakhapatnamensis]